MDAPCSALNELKFANLPVRIVRSNYVTKLREWNSFPRQSLVGRCSCDASNEMFDKPTNFTNNRPKTHLTNKRRIETHQSRFTVFAANNITA